MIKTGRRFQLNRELTAHRNSSLVCSGFSSDPEDIMDENGMNGVLYNLVCEQVLSLPPWTHSTQSYTSNAMDID